MPVTELNPQSEIVNRKSEEVVVSVRGLPKVVRIELAEDVPPYKLRLRFDDGHESLVDFAPFLSQSWNPAVQAYHDRKRFRKFTLEDGVLHWNDFDLVFPMADLYEGRIL
jgi:hypothetical protein